MNESGAHALKRKFDEATATIAIVGQGYVGLPLAMHFAETGFRVVGVDISEEKVAALKAGESYITDVGSDQLQAALDSGLYEPTTDYSSVSEADAVSICVPTPLSKTREPDLSYIRAAAEGLRPHLKSPTLVILESTTYPGTTEEILVPSLLGESRELDKDLFVAFSPERVDPGNPTFHIGNTPKVLGGVTEASGQLAKTLYEHVIDNVHAVGGSSEAEMVKLLENTFRAVNIALVNEMAIMCDRMDIDIWKVIEAAATKPFGFMPFYPGPGIGGHCIPLDPTYLSWRAKTFGFYNRFIELASDLNTNMPRFVVNKLVRIMNDHEKSVKGANVLLVGMAYKPDVTDTRESPAVNIWSLLEEWDANLSYHDPYVDVVPELGDVESVPLTAERLRDADIVVVTTHHSSVDWDFVVEHSQLIFDSRNAIEARADNVYRL